MLYFQTENDILLRPDLEKIAEDHPDQFHLWFTVDKAEPSLYLFKIWLTQLCVVVVVDIVVWVGVHRLTSVFYLGMGWTV